VSSLACLRSRTQRQKTQPVAPPTNDAVSSTAQLLAGGHFSYGAAAYDAAALSQQLAQLRTGETAAQGALPSTADADEVAALGSRWRRLKGDKYLSLPNNRIALREELPATKPFLGGVVALCRKVHRERLHYYPPGSRVSRHPDGSNHASHRLIWTLLSSGAAPNTNRFVIGICNPVAAGKSRRAAAGQYLSMQKS
jgi:hypothetical protein